MYENTKNRKGEYKYTVVGQVLYFLKADCFMLKMHIGVPG